MKFLVKNKNYWVPLLAFVALVWLGSFGQVNAQMGMMGGFENEEVVGEEGHGESLDMVMSELMAEQRVNNADQLDCDRLSDDQLEELGEAVMSEMHPDPEVHERMDAMMAPNQNPMYQNEFGSGQGGEGSESLKQAHINMARNYLGCGGTSNYGKMGMGMMGWGSQLGWGGGDYNMMGYGSWGTGGMMGGSGFVGLGGLFWLINGFLFTALLVTLIRYFWNKGGKK